LNGLALIAAVARNGVIGGDNRLLWRIKADLRHFRDETLGRPVVMGRKTFESIGRPLPGRLNIIMSRSLTEAPAGAELARSLDEAIGLAGLATAKGRAKPDRIMIAGGGDIYAQAIGRADRLFITDVELDAKGDAFFPKIDPTIWREVRREQHAKGPDDDAAYAFVEYLRR
jgi:dihydrofolate reductase